MLVAVPQINHSFAHVNALFLQPTPWCIRNCPGCYVKGFETINRVNDSNVQLFGDILAVINNPNPVTSTLLANQVTFALDRRPRQSPSVMMDNSHQYTKYKRQIMLDLFQRFIDAKHRSIGGEFHVTVHTINDLRDYWNDGLNRSIADIGLDMLSISHLDTDPGGFKILEGLRQSVAPHINWNLTLDPVIDINRTKEAFPIIAEQVDSVYLVLHKPNTGQHLNTRALEVHQGFLEFIRTQPQRIQDKVHIDGCIQDSKKFFSTGYGCSSNVSRFQVWPDGSVTGCAYNQNKITPPASNLIELLKNLTQASKVYEFDQCKIPINLDPRNKHVLKRSNHYLEIIE